MKRNCALLKSFGMIYLIFLLSTLGSARAVTASAPKNMLSPDGWRFIVGAKEGEITSDKVVVGQDAQLSIESYSNGPHNHSWWRQEVSVQEGGLYEYRFQAKGHGGEGRFGVSSGFELLDAQGKFLGYRRLDGIFGNKSASLAEWTTFEGKFKVPPNVASMRLRFSLDAWVPVQAAFRGVEMWTKMQTVDEVLSRTPVKIPVYKIPLPAVSANGVTLTPNWRMDDIECKESAKRYEITLNALWAIQPAKTNSGSSVAASGPKEGDWAFFKMPGYFTGEKYFAIYGEDQVSWRGNKVGRDGNPVWFIRDVKLPRKLAEDDRIYLDFHGMRGLSVVAYWNGVRFGELTDQLGGRIDLTNVIRQANPTGNVEVSGQLALHAMQTQYESQYAFLMEAGVMPRVYDAESVRNSGGGFTGLSIVVEPEEAALPVDQLIVAPSYRNQTLNVLFGAAEIDPTLSYNAVIKGQDGAVVREVSGLQLTELESEQTGLSIEWADPHLWNPEDPYLHTLKLSAYRDGQLVDEALPIRFGFREIWIEGRNMMLNGQVLRLRPRLTYASLLGTDAIRRQFSFMKDMGFNCSLRPGPGGTHEMEHNASRPVEDFYEIADEMGMLVIPFTAHSLYAVRDEFGSEGMSEANLQHLFDYLAKHSFYLLANHPSVIGWSGFGSGANYSVGVNSLAVDPEIWGTTPLDTEGLLEEEMKDKLSRQVAQRRLAASRNFVERIKSYDPTRLYFAHFDGGTGDVWGVWSYFNWTPVQEWEQWPSYWAEHGTMPIAGTEHGFPYPSSFLNHGVPDGNSEPWVVEYATIDLGPEAYSFEAEQYNEWISSSYDPVRGGYSPKVGAHHRFGSDTMRKADELVQQVYVERNHDIFRSWRMYGVSGGIEPFGRSQNFYRGSETKRYDNTIITDPNEDLRSQGFKWDRWIQSNYWPTETMPGMSTTPTGEKPSELTPLGEVLYEVNRPLLVYIAGKENQPTSKDHVFWSGEAIQKQMAVIWDGFSERSLQLSWTARMGEELIAEDSDPIELAGGQLELIPFEFAAPNVAKRAEGIIELKVEDRSSGELLMCDSFEFTVYPGTNAQLSDTSKQARIVILDAAGTNSQTAQAFEKLGYQTSVIAQLSQWSEGDLLVIATGALSALSDSEPSESLPYPAGVPVLVLEQNNLELDSLGFRAYPARHRQVFPSGSSHPILQGVESEDLSNWRVSSQLLPDGTNPLKDGYLYNAGYKGAVAPVSIETPTRGAFTPVLICGFDLRETALLELRTSDTIWLMSQLALVDAIVPESGLVSDPVASQLLANMVDYLVTGDGSSYGYQSIAVIGNQDDVEFLHDLGASDESMQRVETGDQLKGLKLAFVGASVETDSALLAALAQWVKSGGTAVVLPQSDLSVYSRLDQRLQVEHQAAFLLPVPTGSDTYYTGLNQNNFHFRKALNHLVFENGSNLRVEKDGIGQWAWIGFDPRKIDLDKEPYLTITARNQYRTLSQVLTNLNYPIFEPSEGVIRSTIIDSFRLDLSQSGDARIQAANQDGPINPEAWQPFAVETQKTPLGNAIVEIDFELTPEAARLPLIADLGTVDDYDITEINGIQIGSVTPDNSTPAEAWKTERKYQIPAGVIQPGSNTVRMHVWNRNAESKGWSVYLRGPLVIHTDSEFESPYVGDYKNSDDPYLQRMW